MTKWKHALHELEKGTPTATAINVAFSLGGKIVKGISDLINPSQKHHYDKEKEKRNETPRLDQGAIDNVKAKVASPIALVDIRE